MLETPKYSPGQEKWGTTRGKEKFFDLSWIRTMDLQIRSSLPYTLNYKARLELLARHRPFARSGHMVQNHACWDVGCTVGLPKQNKSYQSTSTCLCFGVPTVLLKAPAKRSQHAKATYRNIVGRNMLRAFGHPVATCCDVLGVVGSNLTIFKPESTTPNISQHGGQTHATFCAQQCCDMLRWHVAIVWPGLNMCDFVTCGRPDRSKDLLRW